MKISHALIYGVSKWHFKPYFAVAQTFCQSAVPWKIEKSGMCDISFYSKNLNVFIYWRKFLSVKCGFLLGSAHQF